MATMSGTYYVPQMGMGNANGLIMSQLMGNGYTMNMPQPSMQYPTYAQRVLDPALSASMGGAQTSPLSEEELSLQSIMDILGIYDKASGKKPEDMYYPEGLSGIASFMPNFDYA